jgi:hypothetical protein
MTWRGLVVFVLGIAVLVVAGLAFVNKMLHFVMTISHHDVEGFGVAAVATYLIGMLPIVFLTLWAVLTGRFRDIERPKFRMLEIDAELEAEAARGGRRG